MDITDTVVGRQWGGRNVGLGVALLVAVALRDARAYIAGFAGGLFRDIGDLVGALDDGASPIVPVVVLVLGAIAIGAVIRTGGLSATPIWATTQPTMRQHDTPQRPPTARSSALPKEASS